MTCIVGIVHQGSVYMGGDSAVGFPDSFDVGQVRHPKVFVNGPMLIGWCGSFRMGQLLQYSLKIPKKVKSMDDMHFMTTLFTDAVMKCFYDGGFGSANEEEESVGGDFLVGFNGKLYYAQGDYSIIEWQKPYVAIGSGKSFALGSLYMTDGDEPENRIRKALEVAAHFNAGVIAPFYVLKQERDSKSKK